MEVVRFLKWKHCNPCTYVHHLLLEGKAFYRWTARATKWSSYLWSTDGKKGGLVVPVARSTVLQVDSQKIVGISLQTGACFSCVLVRDSEFVYRNSNHS